jgi:hypothetical protein
MSVMYGAGMTDSSSKAEGETLDPARLRIGDLPTISFARLWHVGSLDVADKRTGSQEGACLSVSRSPGAWREIGEGLVSGPCHVAAAGDLSMLDAHALDAETRAAVLGWGVAAGLCALVDLWTMSWFDDELDDTVSSTFATQQEAEEEAEENDGAEVAKVREHASTPSLDALVLADGPSFGDATLLDMLLPLWTQTLTDLDGVWWDETFDPLAYSAPRGGLLRSRLHKVAWSPCGNEPYDPCDAMDDEDEDDDATDATMAEAA